MISDRAIRDSWSVRSPARPPDGIGLPHPPTVPCDERFTARVVVLRALDRGRPDWCFCGTAPAVSRSSGCLVALLGAVDGGASDTEQVGQFGGAVLTGLEQPDQMCFLSGVELGLLAAQP